MSGFLTSKEKAECFGCGACMQICPNNAIVMEEDHEGFRYPQVNHKQCSGCGLCHIVCPYENSTSKSKPKTVFGGFHQDRYVLERSTSGGAFSAIVDTWCDKDYIIFGAAADKLKVAHRYITDRSQIEIFRKSKYLQSDTGCSYIDARDFLRKRKKVVFSGTPCQIAGIKTFLKNEDCKNLLTVEVICEGVPSPLFIHSYSKYIKMKYGSNIQAIDYRSKEKNRWDFQVMSLLLENGRCLKTDRWFNPFWSIWLDHLMSRPCCYQCPYATTERVADITLGDLWGVHLYCPELYNKNRGASLVVCNTEKGVKALSLAQEKMIGHKLDLSKVLKYQSPMRKAIDMNPQREDFMNDLRNLPYKQLCHKWARRPSLKLLWSKYVWGNRQNVWTWNIRNSKGIIL